MHLTENS